MYLFILFDHPECSHRSLTGCLTSLIGKYHLYSLIGYLCTLLSNGYKIMIGLFRGVGRGMLSDWSMIVVNGQSLE